MRRFTIKSQHLLAGAALTVIASGGWSEAPTREYQVKAAFIYNFTQFVQWPDDAFASADAPFVVGVAGQDPFDGSLEKSVAGKTVGGRPIVIKTFGTVDQVEACHLIFVPAGSETWLPTIIRSHANKPVLTVGEHDSFVRGGGMVRFFTEDNKLRFEVHQDAVESARLKMSSKLLKLAKIYKK